jgi:hypothetical protein
MTSVGFITLDDIVDVLSEASGDFAAHGCQAAVDDTVRRLRAMDEGGENAERRTPNAEGRMTHDP